MELDGQALRTHPGIASRLMCRKQNEKESIQHLKPELLIFQFREEIRLLSL